MPSTNTTYEEIYNRFSRKITDYGLADLVASEDPQDRTDMEHMLFGYLESAISKFKKCEHDLSERDDELRTFTVVLNDTEKEILALMMVTEWLEPRVYDDTLTKQMFAGKEQKYYSQISHLNGLRDLKEQNELRCRKMMRDYTYRNIDSQLG